MKVLCTGAGGFIGGHLVNRLVADGFEVRATDKRPLKDWKQVNDQAENLPSMDLLYPAAARTVVLNQQQVYHLAADTGGMGYIATHKADCMLNAVIDANMIRASSDEDIERFYFASSSCVYPTSLQEGPVPPELAESDVWPALPEPGYGFSKLHTEELLRYARADWGFDSRAGRHQSLYGPYGWYTGGREKVPTALCRKIAVAKLRGEHHIEIWGDGTQVRDFVYISDAVDAIRGIMDSEYTQPLNLGSGTAASVGELALIASEIAGWPVRLRTIAGPPGSLGVQGRSTDITLVTEHAHWKPQVSLREGMELTFPWVYDQVKADSR